jgi:PAS domain S-box-containing protein
MDTSDSNDSTGVRIRVPFGGAAVRMGAAMWRSFDKGILVAFGLLTALLILTAAVTFRNTQHLNEDNAWVAHAQEVLDLTSEVLVALVDAETGQRAFLLSNEDLFLQPYHPAVARLDERLAMVRVATEDNSRQQDNIARLQPMVAAELALLRQGIDLRRQNADQAQLVLAAARGKVQMDVIRDVIADMAQEEHDLLKVREQQSRNTYRLALTTGIVTAVVGLLMVGACFWLFRRNLLVRTQAAAALYEQREWLRTTLSSIGDAVIATDTQGLVTFLNPVAEALTGWEMQAASGKPVESIFRIFNEETRQPVENPVTKLLREGVAVGLANHTILIAKDGHEFAIDDSGAPIQDKGGSVAGVVLVFRDVTERRKETATGMHLASIVESSDDAIIGKTLDGVITSWNPGAERLFGYTAAEIVGSPMTRLIPPDRLDEEPQILAHLRKGESVDHFETVRVTKDGRRLNVSATISPIKNREGNIIGASKIVRDITERTQVEKAARIQAEELTRSNKDLEQFAFVASHDLQEPLRAVAGCLQVLKRRHQGQLDASADELIRHAVDGATRMQTLIEGLLAFSRVGTKGGEFQPVDPGSALDTALDNLATAQHESGAIITHDRLPTLKADPSQLALLFQNLVGNALKFHGTQPPRIHVGVEHQEGSWNFSVRDNGIGIDPQYFERIFVIFQRLHTRGEFAGTGLGLAICKKIVERHGGRISVESAPENGSTFLFSLPELN